MNAKPREGHPLSFDDIDFSIAAMACSIRVSEVFVSDEATKTFNFVAFFVEAGS